MDLIKNLNWRYATKKFSAQTVSQEIVDQLIQAINLSASSTGMQPYRLFVIKNQELRNKMAEGSFNSQIASASHLLVFAAFEKITLEHIENYIAHIASERNIPVEGLEEFKTALVNGILTRSDEVNAAWAAKQAYIALGTALIAAAELKVDSTPMEGFDPEKFDQLLELKSLGLKSVVSLAIGYRDEEADVFAKLKKVRLPQSEFATLIN